MVWARTSLMTRLLPLAALPLLAACGPPKAGVVVAPLRAGAAPVRYEQTRPSMGSLLTIRVVAPETREKKVERALGAAFAAADYWEKLLSEWIPDSPVSRINAAAGKEPVTVPADVIAAFKKAVTVSHASRGAFDITYAGMDPIWNFKPEVTEHEVPTEAQREKARALVDWKKIEINETARTVFLPVEGMKVGFGGIGQGIGADAAAEELRTAGFDDFVVDLSGDAYFAGDAGGEAWSAGIQDPRGERGKIVAKISVRDQAVETSGDYEKYFLADGVRYHHILDPRTAAPARGLSSVTVIADDTTTADAYGTAIFASGAEAGLDLLQRRGLEGVLISAWEPGDGSRPVMTLTSGLKGKVDLTGWTGDVKWQAPAQVHGSKPVRAKTPAQGELP